MPIYRYSEWDGTQDFNLDPDELLKALSDDVLAHGDISQALRQLLRRGFMRPDGTRFMGLQELMQRVRQARQQRLDRYNLGSILDDIRKKLEQVVQTERQGIERRLAEARAQAPQGADDPMVKLMEKVAQRKLDYLDQLPPDLAGQIKALSDYEFMDSEAQRLFQELMQMLQGQVMDSFFRNLYQQIQSLTPEDLARIRQMVQELNRMLEQRMRGQEPDFDRFIRQFGDMFGPNPPQTLDELLEQMRQRMAMMRSLLDSLSPQQRQALQELLESVLKDEGLRQELAALAANLEYLMPSDDLRNRYPFRGDEPLSLQEAMRLMEELQALDRLEQQLRAAEQGRGLDEVDAERLRELLGEEAHRMMEALRQMARLLEEAGYIRSRGNRWELTPRAMRKIGQKALYDIFNQIKKDRFGKHETAYRGPGNERAEETKPYEFGDPFHLQLERTLMNSLIREGPKVPVKLSPNDFEVYQTRHTSQTATVMMLDLSWSMGLRGNFFAAKKVALALSQLIKTQFPRDVLYIVGFSRYARQLTEQELAEATVDEYSYGTNIQHAFMLAQRLLAKHNTANKQIIMVTDGEPTSHIEGGRAFFAYPPTLRTLQLTLQEARNCTRQGIIINTFMLDRSFYMMEFVEQLARINKGRIFYTTPERLGQYVLVDYLANKRRRIA